MAILAVLNDLLFQSKIQAAAQAAGQTVRLARRPEEALTQLDAVSLVLVDLSLEPAALLAVIAALRRQQPQLQIIGYSSHVDTALLAQAQAAGCTRALPRSVFVQQLPLILQAA